MKFKVLLFTILLFSTIKTYAQSRTEILHEIQKLMIEHYVFLDKAEATNQHLDQLIDQKYFEKFETPIEFAKALSTEMQKITKDKHLNVAPPRERSNQPERIRTSFNWHLQNLVRFREGGFGEINIFEGNVGYIKLKGFRVEDTIKVAPIMDYLSTTDAIIIDLRNNGGGNGPVGTIISSYFLPTDLPLTSVYTRRTDITQSYSTVAIDGNKRLDVPLFILINNRTFSAAEAFAYDLQARNRVTIIGENSGGGAHPVNFMPLPNGYRLIIPVARSINPITESNWEGVGVIPGIKASDENALVIAKELAKESAKQYRETTFKALEKILHQDKLTTEDNDKVCELLQLALNRGHIESFMINGIGYDYLEAEKIQGAIAVLRTGIILFPESPNAHDSYAEVLAKNDQRTLALKHYQLAVTLAKNINHRRLAMFKKNLNDFQSKM